MTIDVFYFSFQNRMCNHYQLKIQTDFNEVGDIQTYVNICNVFLGFIMRLTCVQDNLIIFVSWCL